MQATSRKHQYQDCETRRKIYYQVWLDTTTKFDAANIKTNVQTVGITDDFDETKRLMLMVPVIEAYGSVTGADFTDKFDIAVNNDCDDCNPKDGFTKSLAMQKPSNHWPQLNSIRTLLQV